MTKNDIQFVSLGCQMLGCSIEKLTTQLGRDVATLLALEKSPQFSDEKLCYDAQVFLIHQGVTSPHLLRGARALLGLSQSQFTRKCGLAPGTYRKLEAGPTVAVASAAVGSFVKVFAFLISSGIVFRVEKDGAGVLCRGLLQAELFADESRLYAPKSRE